MFWTWTAARWAGTKLNGLTSFFPPPPRDRENDATPRRILLVHAHPVADSFSSSIADAVEAGAKEGGHELRRHSLYKENYRPELTSRERVGYFDRASGSARCSADVRGHLQDLRWADSLVIVYPTWWFNLPASACAQLRTGASCVAYTLTPPCAMRQCSRAGLTALLCQARTAHGTSLVRKRKPQLPMGWCPS